MFSAQYRWLDHDTQYIISISVPYINPRVPRAESFLYCQHLAEGLACCRPEKIKNKKFNSMISKIWIVKLSRKIKLTSILFPPHLVFPFYKVGAFFFECGEPHSGSAVPLRNDNYHFYSHSIGQASHKSLGELKTFSEQLNVTPFPEHPISVDPTCCNARCCTAPFQTCFLVYRLLSSPRI